MATELAKAYIQIIPSMKGVSENINKELSGVEKQSNGKPIGEKIGNVIGTGIGLGIKGTVALAKTSVAAIGAGAIASAKGVAELAKQSLSAYKDYEQLVGGVETLYGSSYSSAEEYAKKTGSSLEFAQSVWEDYQNRQSDIMRYASNAYKTAGMSANEYMETVNGFAASLTASLGQYEWQAGNYADMIVTDMSDNANKMGTDIEAIKNAYAGFSKGQFTMLDNLKLGYGGTKDEMQRLLTKAEELEGLEVGSLSIDSFADITYAIHAVQEELGIAGTTAKEASETIEGSLATMKGAWTNLIAGLSNPDADLGKLVQDLVDSAVTVVKNIQPVLLRALPNIAEAISQLIAQLAPMLPSIINDILPPLLNAITALLEGIVQALPSILQALNAIIPMLVDVIVDNLPALMGAGLQIIVTLASAILENLPKLLESIPKIFRAMVDAFKTVDWKTIGRNIIDGIKNGLASAWSGIISWLKSKCGEMISTVKSFFGIHSPSTVFRDQIGINLAKGLGIGFVDEMDDVNKQMQDAVETEFNVNGSANISADVAKNAYRGSNLSNTDSILTTIVNKLDNLANMQIVLDSGTLVGSTAPQMNVALGRISTREAYR